MIEVGCDPTLVCLVKCATMCAQAADQCAGSPTAQGKSADATFLGSNAGDDRNKAYDAIIVAASTVAVLIANATYVESCKTPHNRAPELQQIARSS